MPGSSKMITASFTTASPVAPPKQQDGQGNVLCYGSYSKLIAPFLRIGFLVCPPQLVEWLVRAKATLDSTVSCRRWH
jgi:GntR family transcriptional regulator/MocR family aminotransferase